MSFHGAILKGGWQAIDLSPGAYVALLTSDENDALDARIAGLHLRDTMLLLGPSTSVSFAFLFRAPMSGTVADNVTTYGTGALHIDACRIAGDMSEFFSKTTGKPRSGMGHAKGYGMGDGYGGDRANPPHEGGRWPSNLAFIHATGCKRAGTKKVKASQLHQVIERSKSSSKSIGKQTDSFVSGYADADGKEVVAAWECAQDCQVAALDRQSGDRPSTLTGRADPTAAHGHPSSAVTDSWFSGGAAKDTLVYADDGGASRFFLQFAGEDEFLAWLRRLLVREGDPLFEVL